jgi:hypothetical protein
MQWQSRWWIGRLAQNRGCYSRGAEVRILAEPVATGRGASLLAHEAGNGRASRRPGSEEPGGCLRGVYRPLATVRTSRRFSCVPPAVGPPAHSFSPVPDSNAPTMPVGVAEAAAIPTCRTVPLAREADYWPGFAAASPDPPTSTSRIRRMSLTSSSGIGSVAGN